MAQSASVADIPPDPEAAAQLTAAARKAYMKFPKNCSGAVHYVITQLVDPDAPYFVANRLMLWLADAANGWQRVLSWQEASQFADRGAVVVAGRAETGGHGHVVIVLPGPWKRSGGYKVKGKTMAFHGLYPPVMSTSLGSWEGAMSNGEKTVYDPWANQEQFKEVTAWTKQAS